MNVHDQTHALSFTDGPLEGHVFHLTGVVPFAQFQIGGDMDHPVFHLYRLDEGDTVKPSGVPGVEPIVDEEKTRKVNAGELPVAYKFLRTYTFEEFAKLFPF